MSKSEGFSNLAGGRIRILCTILCIVLLTGTLLSAQSSWGTVSGNVQATGSEVPTITGDDAIVTNVRIFLR